MDIAGEAAAFADQLIAEFMNASQEREEELIERVRGKISEVFFLSFLEFLVNRCHAHGIRVNSRRILQLLVVGEHRLHRRAFIHDNQLEYGTILQMLGSEEPVMNAIYKEPPAAELIYIFDYVDKKALLSQVSFQGALLEKVG